MLTDWGKAKLTDGNVALHITIQEPKMLSEWLALDGMRENAVSHEDQDGHQPRTHASEAYSCCSVVSFCFFSPMTCDMWPTKRSVSVMCKGEVLGKQKLSYRTRGRGAFPGPGLLLGSVTTEDLLALRARHPEGLMSEEQ